MAAHRRARQVCARRQRVPLSQRRFAQCVVDRAAFDPRAAPVLPPRHAAGDSWKSENGTPLATKRGPQCEIAASTRASRPTDGAAAL